MEATTPLGIKIDQSTLKDFINGYHNVSLRGASVQLHDQK